MQNHNTSQQGPSTISLPDLRALFRSDDIAWEGVPETKSALSCGKTFIWGFNKGTGLDVRIPIESCGTWWHQRCAEKYAIAILADISRRVGGAAGAYFAVVRTSELKGNLIADRKYRKQKNLGRPVWYFTIHRFDGTTFVISSDPLSGRDEPTVFHDVADIMPVAAAALSLPGVVRVDHSRKKGRDDGPSDEDVVIFGGAGAAFHRRVKVAAADVAHDAYGVDVDPLAGPAADGRITSDEWVFCFQQAWDRLKTESQQRNQS
jgi:hypothetical protein